MLPGVEGIDPPTVTFKVWAVDDPQELFATTKIFPPVVPVIAVIELVIEVPDQPLGKVHV